MKSISRQEARERIAAARVAMLSAEERANILDEWTDEDADDQAVLRLAMMQETLGVRNSWLLTQLPASMDGPLQIVGEPEAMLECPCCGYLTLVRHGEYDICRVCFWEDDGCRELDRISGPNHMTLREGKENFARIGACEAAALQHVVPGGPNMYPRNEEMT